MNPEMSIDLLCREFSPQQAHAVRYALTAIDQRIKTLSRCGEKPSQAIEATLREVRLSPATLSEWIPYDPDINDDFPELFRRHSKVIWRAILWVKCMAGIRISAGEETQSAIADTIRKFQSTSNK